nr:retrovirus-related Pol polyprotein from transposon TNT 1-94 [Tanacetum cinerariifolium]
VLVTKPQNKTPYELLTGKIPIISYIRPFGCHATILNTIDHLGKFAEKSDKGFLVGYSLSSKAFKPITTDNKANHTTCPKETNNSAGTQDDFDAENSDIDANHTQEYYVLPLGSSYTSTIKRSKAKNEDEKLNENTDLKTNEESWLLESTTFVNTATTPLNAAIKPTNQDDSQIPALEDIYDHSRDVIFTSASYDDEGAVADFTNLETTMNEEGIDYDEDFAPVARIEVIRIFLAFASYMGFIVYQMRVKSAFLYGKINEEVYVSRPPGFIDPKFPNKVYKVVKALYGLQQAPKACVKTASTHIETKKPLVKDKEAANVDVHFYRSMIGSLMYLTYSRPDIMYLKGQPKLGLWYPRESAFDLEAYSDSNYTEANLDRKSTIGGCQFLGGHTSGRAEGILNLEELYALCTNLSNRVLALETVKDAQDKEILTLKARIKKLEKRYTLIKLKDDKAKGVAFKDLEDTNRPARSILTLKPLPTIDPKDKGKGVLEEPESEKKMTKSDFDATQIARDEEIARQLEVELQAKVEKERQREEQASMDYIANLYDEV